MATTNDDPLAELVTVRNEIHRTEDEILPALRERRDKLICIAREHGAIGDDLADASGLSRQSVHTVLRAHKIAAPNRTHSAARHAHRTRTDLRRALAAAGIPHDDNPEDIGRAVADALRTEHTEHETERT